MSITIKEEIAYRLPYPLFNNQWLLTLEDNSLSGIQFMVKSVELPNSFPSLTTAELPNGNHYYEKADFDKEWSFTISEDIDARAYTFFKNWMDSVYDPVQHKFNLTGGNYIKDFRVALMKPGFMNQTIAQSITSTRTTNSLSNIAENIVANSAIGRLEGMARQLIQGAITDSGAGVGIVQRSADYAVSTIGGIAQGAVSYGMDYAEMSADYHTESQAMAYKMNNTILKSIDKITLDYGDGEPLQWKVTLASDIIEVDIGEDTTTDGGMTQ